MFRLNERMVDVEIEDFVRVLDRDVSPLGPTIELAYVPAKGVTLEGIDRASLERLEQASSCTRLARAALPYCQTVAAQTAQTPTASRNR